MIGDSNTDICFDTNDFYNATQKTLIKYTLNGISAQEQYEVLKAYLTVHPDTKSKFIISINFSSYVDNDYNYLPKFYPDKITLQELFSLLFSITAAKASLETILWNMENKYLFSLVDKIRINKYLTNFLTCKKLKIKYEAREIFPNLRIKIYTPELNPKSIYYLNKMTKLLKEKNIKCYFILNIVHTYTLANFYKSGKWNLYMDFKKQFSQLTPFYDFSFVNEYNQAPITFSNIYFQDSMHPTNTYGKMVLENIVEKDYMDNTSFGMLIDKNNIDNAINMQTKRIEKFIKNNPEIINKYMKNEIDDLTKKVQYKYY